MKVIIELRLDDKLEKDGTTLRIIKQNNHRVYAKTLDLNTGKIKEYSSIEILSGIMDDAIFAVYNNTDIKFIQQLEFIGCHDVTNKKHRTNKFYRHQNNLYTIDSLDKNNFGILRQSSYWWNVRVLNLARLIITSPIPLSNFISESRNCIAIPDARNPEHMCYCWNIKNIQVLTDIVDQSKKYGNLIAGMGD